MPEHLENPYFSGEQAAAERRVQIGPNGEKIYPHIGGHHLGANMGKPPELASSTLGELALKQRHYRELTAAIDDLEERRTPLGKEIRQLSEKAQKELGETLSLIEQHNPSVFPAHKED